MHKRQDVYPADQLITIIIEPIQTPIPLIKS